MSLAETSLERDDNAVLDSGTLLIDNGGLQCTDTIEAGATPKVNATKEGGVLWTKEGGTQTTKEGV